MKIKESQGDMQLQHERRTAERERDSHETKFPDI